MPNEPQPLLPPPAPDAPAPSPGTTAESGERILGAAIPFPRRNLTRAQQRRLENWLLENWPAIERDAPTQARTASRATVALGFRVTRGHLLGAIRATDKTWPVSRHAAFVAHTNRLAIATLAAALVDLYRSLGRPTSPALADLHARSSAPQPDPNANGQADR